jgi:hypothetical protein
MIIPHLKAATSQLWVETTLSAMITHNDSSSIASYLLKYSFPKKTPIQEGRHYSGYFERSKTARNKG